MSTLTQFLPQNPPAGIKSVQRGTITLGSGTSITTVGISSVNTSKTFLNWLGSITSTTTDPYTFAMIRLELTDSTTITAYRGSGTNSGTVSYEVVEFN